MVGWEDGNARRLRRAARAGARRRGGARGGPLPLLRVEGDVRDEDHHGDAAEGDPHQRHVARPYHQLHIQQQHRHQCLQHAGPAAPLHLVRSDRSMPMYADAIAPMEAGRTTLID